MRKKKIVCMLLMIGALALLFKPGLKIGDVINFSSPEIEWLSL